MLLYGVVFLPHWRVLIGAATSGRTKPCYTNLDGIRLFQLEVAEADPNVQRCESMQVPVMSGLFLSACVLTGSRVTYQIMAPHLLEALWQALMIVAGPSDNLLGMLVLVHHSESALDVDTASD